MFLLSDTDLDRRAETEDRDLHLSHQAAVGVACSNLMHEAREALMRNPTQALRNPSSQRCPVIRASNLLEWIDDKQQVVLAEILARAALAGDGMAQTLIDALAADYADRNAEECAS